MLDDLDALVREAMAEWKVPGLAIAVIHRDEPVFVKAFGQRDLDTGLPVTTDTQFLLCSVTKSFTSAGLTMLADERRLDWRKPVREYLPEFRLHDPVASDRATVMDLLCHRTGLPRHDWVWMPGDRTHAQMLAALRHLEPSRDLREAYQYQNLGYLAAGAVAERITGQAWQDFTRDRILSPLGMRDHGFSAQDLERATDSARPHWYDMDADLSRRAPIHPVSTTPAGGINASISGMANYLRLLLGGGSFDGVRLLSPEGARLMQTPLMHVARPEFDELGEQHYGLGLACYSYRGERAVAHDGGWVGWGTRVDMLPDRGIGVAVLTNRTGSPVTTILGHAVFDRLTGREPVPWLDRFRERRRQFLAQRGEHRAARASTRKPHAPPSHASADYAGEYEHPGYGRIAIDVDGDHLSWRFRGMAGPLAHRHYDVFEVPERPDTFGPDLLTFTFGYDPEGEVDRLSVPFEPAVGTIVFQRLPRGEALDPAFRRMCVGRYRCGAQVSVVALGEDGGLTLSPSDQPTYRLLPYAGRKFAIAGLDGYRVEFRAGDADAVEALIFHQPNGIFHAGRIPVGPDDEPA